MRLIASVVVAAFLITTASCTCMTAEQKKTYACVIQRASIDCGVAEMRELESKLFPLVEYLIDGAGGDPNWEQYLIALEGMGIDVVACTAQAVIEAKTKVAQSMGDGQDLPMMTAAAGAKAKTAAAKLRFESWKTKRLPNTDLKR